MKGRGRKPPVLPDDAALWDQVARTVSPLRPQPAALPAEAEAPVEMPKPQDKVAPSPPPGPAERRRPPPALSPLDRRTRGKLARGVVAIDARVDLHGLTQAAAHRRLTAFLGNAQASGARLALVITGKGGTGEAPHGEAERGVLRRMVPIWLAAPELRGLVVGFEPAGRSHGGDGALYVRIRRRKSD